MAGVKAIVTTDIDTRLAELTAALDDRTALFAQINEYLHRAHRERFSKQVSPDGKAWQALSPRYAKTKRRNANRILVLRGHLLSWLRGQYDNDNLEFGTNQPYGAIHHFGGTIKRKARSQDLYFKQGQDGSVGNRFVKKKNSNFVQTVQVGEYNIKIPARPWLGLSNDNKAHIVKITQRYLKTAISA